MKLSWLYTVSSHVYVPTQVPLRHLGASSKQAALFPHLHTFDLQVSEVSEHASLAPHLHVPKSQWFELPEQSELS